MRHRLPPQRASAEVSLIATSRIVGPAAPRSQALFTLRDDHRPAGERDAAERYREPSLFTALERRR
jgi:hypothetical protein